MTARVTDKKTGSVRKPVAVGSEERTAGVPSQTRDGSAGAREERTTYNANYGSPQTIQVVSVTADPFGLPCATCGGNESRQVEGHGFCLLADFRRLYLALASSAMMSRL